MSVRHELFELRSHMLLDSVAILMTLERHGVSEGDRSVVRELMTQRLNKLHDLTREVPIDLP